MHNSPSPMHKAIRACLYETAILLQRADFTLCGEANRAVSSLQEAINLIEDHKQVCKSVCQEVIGVLEPVAVKELIALNSQINKLVKNLEEQLEDFSIISDCELRVLKGEEITTLYNQFIIVILSILNDQDNRTNSILWKYFSDYEVRVIKQIRLKDTSDRQLQLQFKWLIRGNTDKDVIFWLINLRNRFPGDLLSAIESVAEQELPENRWIAIQHAIADGSLLSAAYS